MLEHKPLYLYSLIKDMISEKLREEYGQTPQEFCEDVGGIEIGGMTQ